MTTISEIIIGIVLATYSIMIFASHIAGEEGYPKLERIFGKMAFRLACSGAISSLLYFVLWVNLLR